MKQIDKQKNAEKMNESMDAQQKARKTYIENHPDSTDKISKKIVENSFILSIAERYNNGKPYDFNDIRQFMKFINDFFRVELKGKSDIPQLDLQNIVKFNSFDEWISNSYQCATFSHSFIMGNSKEEYFKSSLPRLIFYYNDNLGNLDHYQLEINFTWDIHLKYGFYQILEKFNNDNFFDPEKPIYIAKFMHFIMNLYKKFNSIEFKRIMKANTKKKISNYKTICCIECFLALKNENHYRKHEFYKTFYEEWTLPYKISWNNFAKYWNTKIVPDKPDMQIKSTIYYKDSVSESMDAVRKIRKQKENTENAETTEQKAGKFADNIVLKSKIRELFMKYAPEEKNQDLNNPEIFIQIVNGYLTHYLQTPINLHIDIIKEKISSKNGNGFLFNTYYPTQKNLHAWLLSSKNLKNYEMYYNFPFNYIKSKIFFRKNFIQALFKGNIAYDVQIDLKFRLLIENDVVSQIDLIFSAGINNDHHVISEFTIYFPISDLNNSDSVFQIFSCCTKILKRIETPEFLAYILTCRILNEAMYSIHNGIHKNKIIEQYILVSVFMDIDKSGRLQKEYTDNKKLILQTDSAYAKDANDTYHDKLDYARRCFKLCDNEYINSNTQVDESMNAWKKIAIVNSHKEDNAGKKIADETFLSELFMNFFPESKNHDLNDEKNIIGIIRGFIRKKYNDSSIQLALADYSYSETEATTKKYKKYFRVEDNTVMLNTKTEGLLDKEKYHLNMIVFFSYSDRNIESISLNLFYGTGDYKKSRQVNIFHVPFLKDKCLNLYYFIKYLNETIDILRSSQFAAFILTYNELYQNKPNDYDTDSFMVNFLFYSIFLNVMKKDKSKKQEINNVFMFMNDNDIDTNDAREKKTIMKIYNQQLESVNRQSEINSAVSESMDTVRKMRKQKENVENAETTEQKAGKFADNIVSKSKIRELFMKYAPDSKSHDLNDAKNILRIINGFIQQKCHQQKISIQFQYNRDSNDELGESSTVLNPHGYISMFDCMLHYFGIKEPESLYLQNDNMQAFYRSNGLLATIQIRFITSGMKLKYIDIILNYGAFYNPKNRINGMKQATNVCISSISFDKDKTVSFFKFLNSLNSLMNKIKTSEFTAYLMLFKKLFFNQNKYLNNHYAKTVLKTKNGEILNTDTSKEFKIIFYYIFKDILTSDTNIELKNELKEENISSKNNSENAFLIKKLYNDELKSVNEYNSNSKSLISESMDTWKKLRSKQKTENADAGKKVAHDLFLTQLFSKFAPDSKSHDLNDTSVLMDVLTGYMKFLYNNPKLKAKHNSNLISNDKVTYSINNPFNSKDARRMDIINSDFCYGVNTIFTIKFVYEYSADFNRENSRQLKYIAFAIAICNCMPDFSLEYDIDQSVKIENQIIGIMKWLHEIQKKLLSMKFMAVLRTNYILQQKSANHSKVFPKYNSLYMAGLELKIFTRLKAENNDSVSLQQKLFLRAQKDMYYKKNTQFKLLWDNMYAIYKKELAKIKTMKISGISESMDAWKKVKSKQEFKDNTENMTDQLFISKLFMKYYPEAKTYDLNDVPTLANLLQGYIQKRFLRKQGRLIFSGIFSQEELQTVNNFAISNKISDIKKYSDCEVRYDICHLLNLKTEQKLKNLKVFIPLGNETTVKHLTIWVDIFFKVSKYKITGIRFIVHYEIGNSKNETKIILDKDFDSINNLNMIMEIFRIIDALRNDLSSMKFESLLDTTYILQDIGLENIISFSDYQNTTAHKVSLYAPAIKTFSFMKMGKSEISYEEYELDDDSKTKKGIINFDDNPSETEEISLGLKIFNSEIIRIKGDTTDTELISESMDAWKRFSSTEKDDVAPEELGKNIALKYNLNRLFDQFAPDIDNSNRNTQNLKSVIELLTNFCKEKIDHHYFNKTEFISLKSRAHLYQKDEVELERDKPYIPQIILNPLTKSNENDISLFKYNENHIFLSFKILSLTSEYGCLESIKIKLNFINFGQTVKTSSFENTISITYQIKNNTDFEAIFSIMKFILGFNEFLKDGKCAALVDTMYLSFTQNHLIPPMSSIYYNQLICDLMKEYDSTGKLQHISEQQQKWIMESKENQLKYEIIYHAYLKQYDKICRKIKKSEGKISESMDAYNKIARQHSNDKIKNNTDEMICRSALMSLCGGQYVEGKSIIEMLKIIIPRIFRKIHGLVPDAEKEPQFIEIPNQDKIKNYPSMQSYGISAIPLISLKKEFSKNINQNSENDTIFTDIQIRSKNILKASTSSDTGTAIITTLSDKTVSELSCKHFTINFNQYDEGYKYAPDPDNYLTLGYRIDFDINFYIGNPGILKYSEDNDMSYSQKYSILALFIRDMLKALDFLISPLLTEGLKQMLVILKDINLDDLKERKISIINFFTTFEYFFRKHVSNFNGIAYDDVYKDRDEYNTLKYEPEIQENARKFSEKFYDEHLKKLE